MTHADTLGDRMKAYEAAETNRRFMPLLPIYARIDGRCFSKFTNGMDRPSDLCMSTAMKRTTEFLVEKTNASVGYTQSDEISLCWKNDDLESEMLFGGKPFKFMSVLAGMTSAFFNQMAMVSWPEKTIRLTPSFDARAFQLPNLTEASNAFLWRVNDAVKNSVSMAAQSQYSHKELQGKNAAQMHEMLRAKGINWNNYSQSFKEGSFFKRVSFERPFTQEELNKIPAFARVGLPPTVIRHEVREMWWPRFGRIINKNDVLFDNATPVRNEE